MEKLLVVLFMVMTMKSYTQSTVSKHYLDSVESAETLALYPPGRINCLYITPQEYSNYARMNGHTYSRAVVITSRDYYVGTHTMVQWQIDHFQGYRLLRIKHVRRRKRYYQVMILQKPYSYRVKRSVFDVTACPQLY